MSFEKITIQEAVEHVRDNDYVLPAIQREFVWSTEQITRLFDSLMCGYPIGSFLFWKVDHDNRKDYRFYGFLSDYHERKQRHNKPIDLEDHGDIIAILDGQQRLTSLHIGLLGSYASKIKHKRWDNDDAFPQRRLHLNLLSPASDEEVDLKYNFRFLTEAEVENNNNKFWFPVSQILEFDQYGVDIQNYLQQHGLAQEQYPPKYLHKLKGVICRDELINYYQEKDQDLDKVLNIFIRVNSGGTELSHSDLLLSIATAQWKIDAREEIHGLVDALNDIGGGFNFSKDFVLKSCLVLADLDIGFKVKNFTRDNTKKIETAWPKISDALRCTVTLAARFGYNGRTLTANNVLIPIAYYLFVRDIPEGFITHSRHAGDRKSVHDWIVHALLKSGTFGSSLDTTLRAARSTIQKNPSRFPSIRQLHEVFVSIGKELLFDEEDLDNLLDQEHGKGITFTILTLLNPGLIDTHDIHEDHVFPKSKFTPTNLSNAGVPEEQIEEFQERQNRIANLQLLQGIANQEKHAKMPSEWLSAYSQAERERWKQLNLIDNIPNDMTGFLEFYEARREMMKIRLAKRLGVPLADKAEEIGDISDKV